MDQDLEDLLKSVGKTVETTGRMLQRDPPFPIIDLAILQRTLQESVKTLGTVQKVIVDRHLQQSREEPCSSRGS